MLYSPMSSPKEQPSVSPKKARSQSKNKTKRMNRSISLGPIPKSTHDNQSIDSLKIILTPMKEETTQIPLTFVLYIVFVCHYI